jgi:hypothetical protein
VADLGGAAAPGGSTGPGGAAGLPPGSCVARLWCVCLVQHDRDEFGLLGVNAQDFTWCELAQKGKVLPYVARCSGITP